MSITISLHLDTPDVSGDSLARHMAALGFHRPLPPRSHEEIFQELQEKFGSADERPAPTNEAAEQAPEQPACVIPSVLNEPSVVAKRERGKPGPGRKRRTAEEVAEDEAADRAEATPAAAPESTSGVSVLSAGTLAEPASDITQTLTALADRGLLPQIRTEPENRIGPEDSPEVQAQDEADEAAESAAAVAERLEKEPERVFTHDDLRKAMGAYATKYGMPVTIEDGPAIFVGALGTPPEGNPIWKLSLVPDEQQALGKAVAAWTAALEQNPNGREAVGG